MELKFKMNAPFVVSIDEIKKQVKAGEAEAAIESLQRLWKYCAMVKKNEEVINCSSIHSPEVVEGAKKELSRILWNTRYPHEIEL